MWEEVRSEWRLHRHDVNADTRQRFRGAVLGCTQVAVQDVVRRYLHGVPASRAAFAGSVTKDLARLEVVYSLTVAGAGEPAGG